MSAFTSQQFQSNGGNPTEDEIIGALAKHFDAPEGAAIAWLRGLQITFNAKAAQERLVARFVA